jgi:hypothetical protein
MILRFDDEAIAGAEFAVFCNNYPIFLYSCPDGKEQRADVVNLCASHDLQCCMSVT